MEEFPFSEIFTTWVGTKHWVTSSKLAPCGLGGRQDGWSPEVPSEWSFLWRSWANSCNQMTDEFASWICETASRISPVYLFDLSQHGPSWRTEKLFQRMPFSWPVGYYCQHFWANSISLRAAMQTKWHWTRAVISEVTTFILRISIINSWCKTKENQALRFI